MLVPFAGYAFNKAHSAAYGVISYWTAYLKANYPTEYMAGLLTSVRDDKDKSALYLGECRHMGITVLAAGRQLVVGELHGRRQGHPVRSDRRPQRRRQRGRRDRAGARGEGRVHVLHRLPRQGAGGRLQQADHRVADQGRRVRLARSRAARAAAGARAGGRLGDRRQAQGGRGPVRPVRRPRWAATTARRASRSSCRTCRTGTRSSGSRSSGRCSACTCPTTRCPGSSTCSPPRRTCRSPRCCSDEQRPDGSTVVIAGLITVAAAQDVQAGQPVGRGHDRGHGGLGRDHVLRRDLPGVLHGARRGRGRGDPRAGAAARRDDAAAGHGGVAAGRVARRRTRRSWSRWRSPGARRRWWSGSARCSPRTRA